MKNRETMVFSGKYQAVEATDFREVYEVTIFMASKVHNWVVIHCYEVLMSDHIEWSVNQNVNT